MNFIIFILLSLFLLSSCQTTGRIMNTHSGYGNFRDNDWNETFYANARLPSKNSIKWIKENENQFLRFTLKDKDIGWSHSDRKPRHSAPYWERAELKQRMNFRKDSTYEIKFKVRFIEGFEGNRETFFQIHQYSDNCKVGPPMMLKFHNEYLVLDAKRSLNHHKRYYVKKMFEGPKIEELLNQWHNFKIIYSSLKKRITISLNNNAIFKNIEFVPYPCGIPHIKFGIYRPGNEYLPIKTSVADFDKFEIREIK